MTSHGGFKAQVRITRNRDLTTLLTQREKGAVKTREKLFLAAFHRPASSEANLVAYLGGNPKNRLTWSATSKRIPTFKVLELALNGMDLNLRYKNGPFNFQELGVLTASDASFAGEPGSKSAGYTSQYLHISS